MIHVYAGKIYQLPVPRGHNYQIMNQIIEYTTIEKSNICLIVILVGVILNGALQFASLS